MADLRKAFLHDIIENIEDDAPRLVFADWLEDNGDPERAEFIRLQCKIAVEEEWPKPSESFCESLGDARERTLIATHGEIWKKEAPKWALQGAKFRRGFIGGVQAKADVFLKGVGSLYGRAPIESVTWTSLNNQLIAALANRAELKFVRHLLIPTNGCSVSALTNFFHSADLRRLTTLDFDQQYRGPSHLKWILDSERTDSLRHFSVLGITLETEGAAQLAESALLRQLKSLSFFGGYLPSSGATTLVRSPGVAGLESLNLWAPALNDSTVFAMASSPHLANLRYLGLGHNRKITHKGVRALATSPSLTGLNSLRLHNLDENVITLEVAAAIAESENLLHLRRLYLDDAGQANAILARIAQRRRERGLE